MKYHPITSFQVSYRVGVHLQLATETYRRNKTFSLLLKLDLG